MVLVCLAALVPASTALANSGDDQYCDPFSGCGVNKQTHPRVPGKQPRVSHKSTTGTPLVDRAAGQNPAAAYMYTAQPRISFRSASPKPNKSRVEQERLADARNVLRAAGLDSLSFIYN